MKSTPELNGNGDPPAVDHSATRQTVRGVATSRTSLEIERRPCQKQAGQKLIFLNNQAPGDIVMLTAALRDLHRCYPDQFVTDVRTTCMPLWENNPYRTPLDVTDPDVKILDCQYPLFKKANHRPVHFLEGFVENLNCKLHLEIKLTEFKGDIHLSEQEKGQPSPVQELTGEDLPYWIIAAGGKFDITIKWWHFRRWQTVVDHLLDRIQFVQVGEEGHYHPPMKGAIDLRGKTTLRELIRLVYHAQGVLCPVTFLMHLAAAVETKPGSPKNRPCVVVAGGREPPHWEAYPTHQFIHTVGTLPCCATGGCWKLRTLPLGDGDEMDEEKYLCVDVVNGLPRCMDLITPQDVIRGIERYLNPCALRQGDQLAAWASLVKSFSGVGISAEFQRHKSANGINNNNTQ